MEVKKRSVKISSNDMFNIRKRFSISPLIQTVRQLIHHQLLNNGIQFCKNKCDTIMDDSDPIVNEKWIPFAHDVIDSVLCFGFAVVQVGKNKYPKVLEDKSYRLELEYTEKFEYKYTAYTTDDPNKTVQNVIVYYSFRFIPSLDGTFNSPMVKALTRIDFLDNLRYSCSKIEHDRAHPVYFSEIKETDGNKVKEGVDYDFYAEANSSELSSDMKFSRNKSAVELLNRQKHLYNDFYNMNHAKKANKKLESIIQLPMGHSIVNPPNFSARGDLTNLIRVCQEEICASFGIPRSIVFSDTAGNVKGDSFGTHQTFMHTLMWWKKKLSIVMADCYNIIHLDEIMKNIDFKSGQSVEKLKKEHTVTVTFPVTPMVENEQLRMLYEQGIISFENYGKYVLRNIGLPLDLLQKKPPPIDELLFEKPPQETPGTTPAPKKPAAKKPAAKKDTAKKPTAKKPAPKKPAAKKPAAKKPAPENPAEKKKKEEEKKRKREDTKTTASKKR